MSDEHTYTPTQSRSQKPSRDETAVSKVKSAVRSIRPMQTHPIFARKVSVLGITDVTPNLRRLRLGGTELLGGIRDGITVGPFISTGFDDHVKMVFPNFDGSRPMIGKQEAERIAWQREALMNSRDYTVRAVDLGATPPWFEIEVVRHDSGLASSWAYRCELGDEIEFAGPKRSEGVPKVDWLVLMADETGLPAVARFLEETAQIYTGINTESDTGNAQINTQVTGFVTEPPKSITVLIEVAESADVQKFPALEALSEIKSNPEQPSPTISIQWLIRSESNLPAGDCPLLLDALRSLKTPRGRGFLWAAAEAKTLAPIRRYALDELGLDKLHVDISGYWKISE